MAETSSENRDGIQTRSFVGSASLVCSSIDQASWNWTLVVDLSEESGKSGWEEVGGREDQDVKWVGLGFLLG